MSIYGVDISKHQTNQTVREIKRGGKADFVIVRAAIGSEIKDQKFDTFTKDIKDLGFKNGYYCASYAKNEQEAIAEADFMISLIKKDNNPTELPVFFDWEYFSAEYIKEHFGIIADKKLIQAVTVAFCERIKQAGFTAGVYANKDYITRFYTDDFWRAHPDYKFWYTRPGLSKPDHNCYLWQYASNNGRDFGYTGGNIDKNILMDSYIENVKPMKPLSKESCRMYIGYASAGDVKKLVTKINGLGIQTEVKDGYITTGYASSGDQCYIMIDCNALGIPYKIYEEPKPQPPVQECEDCKKLKEENQELKENISILENDKAELINKLESAEEENQKLIEDKDKLSQKINKIKNIVEE